MAKTFKLGNLGTFGIQIKKWSANATKEATSIYVYLGRRVFVVCWATPNY